jgi:hypothetical protein
VLSKVVIDGVEFDPSFDRSDEGMLRLRYSLPSEKTHYRVLARLTSQNGGLSGKLLVHTRRRNNRNRG